VLGPLSRPYADFLAALGLSRKGNPHGLQVNGFLLWQSNGSLTEQFQQGPSCTSTGPLPAGYVNFSTAGRQLTATYSSAASPRTRCPGPELGQFQTLASGRVSRAALGRPRFTLRLSGKGPIADDGYSISRQSSFTLTLKRGRVHEQTFFAPRP
jgi:hypothetical protein